MKVNNSSLTALIALSTAVAAKPCEHKPAGLPQFGQGSSSGSSNPFPSFGGIGAPTATGSPSVSSSSPSSISPPATDSPAAVPTAAPTVAADEAASSVLDAPRTIAAGESFDGAGATFDRGVTCTGQVEGGSDDAVFILEAGATLSNVVIGPNQIEGVHCYGGCTLENVVWTAVCEDAFTVKEQADGETTTIIGGSAAGAEDKVLQHNGGGTIAVSGFAVEDFGKLYRSCGNCGTMHERHVTMEDITATDGSVICGINTNYGDTCTVSSGTISGVNDICCEYEGNDTGDEPTEIGCGASDACNISVSSKNKRAVGSKFHKWM